NWEFSWIVLRKDLADSGKVKTIADLKGMKIAIPSTGSVGDMTVQKMLQDAGVKPGEVEVVVIPPADQAAALANGAIAASYTPEPYIAQGVQQGFSVKWLPNSKTSPDNTAQNALIVFGSALLKDQDLARRWLVAYLKGARDYLKAFGVKEGRQDIVNILVKYTTVKDPKLYDVMEMPYLDPNGQPNMNTLEDQYKWFAEKGLYTGKKTLKDIIDLSHMEYAVQKLGKQ
ncbi:MAG TPA: ABC transporter substrate-binding protein, partial [Dehalococcoidia bacterium]|nr:ABC transporter substrate-binding protein [Dehalococcoidia bacterium]